MGELEVRDKVRGELEVNLCGEGEYTHLLNRIRITC